MVPWPQPDRPTIPAVSIPSPLILIVMGVAGAGKTTIAKLLAEALHCPFLEGDDLHPPSNIAKIRRGVPLDDADRLPWLKAIAAAIDAWQSQGSGGVVTCSALKRRYRDILTGQRRGARLVYLHGSKELIGARLAARHGHFMPAARMDSQLAALEGPGPDENPITVDVAGEPDAILRAILDGLRKLAK